MIRTPVLLSEPEPTPSPPAQPHCPRARGSWGDMTLTVRCPPIAVMRLTLRKGNGDMYKFGTTVAPWRVIPISPFPPPPLHTASGIAGTSGPAPSNWTPVTGL